MSLDADVAAVVSGSRPHVRGILRLSARPPPSYSTIASRQATPPARSTPLTTQPTHSLQQHSPTPAVSQQAWQTVVVKRRGDTHATGSQQAAVVDSVSVDAEAMVEESRADARRRRKKKAGEPPPPSLHFAELLEAQLRRAEEKKRNKSDGTAAEDKTDTQPHNTAHPSASATASPDPPFRSGSKRGKVSKLKQQVRQQQLHTFIRQHILAPIVQAVVTRVNSRHTADGSMEVSGGGEESERREWERREKKRMLRHIKRKQKRMDKHASNERTTTQLTHEQPQLTAAPLRTAAAQVGGVEEEEKEGRERQGDEDADDGTAAVVVDCLLPPSQLIDADEDPSCPTQPYSFTADERAFLFQHVVVDRYHSQPPLSPLVSALCQQLFTPSVDSPVAHLLLALASYQRRALSSPSPLVRARGRRMVMGLREAVKRLKQSRLLLLVLPHNVDTSHPLLASQLTALYLQCVLRRVDVVWSLSRRRLANCCGVKGRVAVVGVVSGEGCSELMRAVRERAREAREGWGLRGWDERVEAGVRERREAEEAAREAARQQWQEQEAEARREEKKKEKTRLEQEMAAAHKRNELLRQQQLDRRLLQQQQAVLQREADERREQERIAVEAEVVRRRMRQERLKGGMKGEEKVGVAVGRDGGKGGGEVSGGKKTWLEEAVEGKEGGVSERTNGNGKQDTGRGKGKGITGKGKNRR